MLALTQITQDQWQVIREQANILVQSRFVPATIKTAEQALGVILAGQELGIPPMAAMRSITMIDGKPTCSAALMQALIYRDHGDEALQVVESTNEVCRVQYKRRNWLRAQELSFTIEDAKRAKLAGKNNWQNYPAAMLRARAISAAAMAAFADTCLGMYTPDELGAETNADGEIIDVQPVAQQVQLQAPPSREQVKQIVEQNRREFFAELEQPVPASPVVTTNGDASLHMTIVDATQWVSMYHPDLKAGSAMKLADLYCRAMNEHGCDVALCWESAQVQDGPAFYAFLKGAFVQEGKLLTDVFLEMLGNWKAKHYPITTPEMIEQFNDEAGTEWEAEPDPVVV